MKALDNRHMALAPWADEEDVEEDVKKRSVTPDAMGAKTLCIPFEQVRLEVWICKTLRVTNQLPTASAARAARGTAVLCQR